MGRLADNVDRLAENVEALRARAVTAERRLREWQNDSYPRGSGFDSIGRSTVGGSPVETAVLAPDELRAKADRLHKVTVQARQLTDEACSIVAFTLDPAPEVKRQPSVVKCYVCAEPALPRVKSGRCPACYEYRRRNGHDRKVERDPRR